MKKTPATTKVTTSAPDKRNFIEINRSRRALPGGKVTPKAKAPVLSHTVEIAGNLPDSEVFSRPEFGNAALRRLHGFGAGSAHPQGRQHGYLHVTIPSPTLWPSQPKRGFQSQIGAETMMTVITASRCAAPAIQSAKDTTHLDTISNTQAFALLDAINGASLAGLYLSRGNVPAARRKAVQLLKALQVLEAA